MRMIFVSSSVKGFDELQKTLKDLAIGTDPTVFAQWGEKIQISAKNLCNDHESERIKFEHTQELGFRFEFADKEAIDCVIMAIKQQLNSMPLTLKMVYEQLIKRLETRKQQLS